MTPENSPDPRAAAALAAATRRVIDVVRRSAAGPEPMREATAALEAIARGLEAEAHPGPFMQRELRWTGELARPDVPHDFADFFPYSPIIGLRNPLAPPATFEIRDGRVHGRVTYSAAYVGPPQSVHGGVIAATLDELLGSTNLVHQVGGMTGTLTVRYRAPTPILREIELEGWLTRVDGRKVYTRGEMRHEGRITAEAEGVFIRGSVEQLKATLAA
jgi:acyl-coenzyme A thioesterase PaaI-like protein